MLAEDDPSISEPLARALRREGYEVGVSADGPGTFEVAKAGGIDLIVLDIGLPRMDGLEVCRHLRQMDSRLPILILTARVDEEDRIKGLSGGADDYLTKPFSLDEFLLRVKGMLRRSEWYRPKTAPEEHYRFGENEVNLKGGMAATPRGEIALTDLEVKMLHTFFRAEGQVLSRAELLKSVWGVAPDTETRTLDTFILRMRKYFEPEPAKPVHFLTVRGRGYRFDRRGDGDT